MKTKEIIQKISDLKEFKKRIYSNCFVSFNNCEEQEWEAFSSPASLYIVNKDNGVNRIWFYTVDFADLKQLFDNNLPNENEYLIDIIAKDKNIHSSELAGMGFAPFTQMMRMSNRDISAIISGPVEEVFGGHCATESDVEDIYTMLYSTFDTRISHLPDKKSLLEVVKKGEFYIQRNSEGEIVALLQAVIEPKSFYINQVINATSEAIVHEILMRELKKYYDAGGKYLYAWVEEKNIASVKFHQKFGLIHDGLWDIVYRKEKA